MSDLISRADALEALKDMSVTYDAETVQRCIEAVSNLPTVDAVPVIRCKDCKYSLQNQFTGDWFCWLYNIAREVESDGFCYKAERINSGQRYATDLIRCKDCKFRDPKDKRCVCGHDIIWQLPRGDEWYCADAKRDKAV